MYYNCYHSFASFFIIRYFISENVNILEIDIEFSSLLITTVLSILNCRPKQRRYLELRMYECNK